MEINKMIVLIVGIVIVLSTAGSIAMAILGVATDISIFVALVSSGITGLLGLVTGTFIERSKKE